MGAPTTEFKQIPTDGSVAAGDIDTGAERNTAMSTWSAVDVGTPLDFGSVSISGGAANSSVQAVAFRVTAFNGNTTVTNMRFWVTENFADSTVNWAKVDLDAGDWVATPTPSNPTSAATPTSEPGTQNVLKADSSTTDLTDEYTDVSDTTEAIVLHIAVGASETLGTYQGTAGSQDLQFNLKFDFS